MMKLFVYKILYIICCFYLIFMHGFHYLSIKLGCFSKFTILTFPFCFRYVTYLEIETMKFTLFNDLIKLHVYPLKRPLVISDPLPVHFVRNSLLSSIKLS